MLCSTYHVLPNPGGLFDQDSYVVYGLSGAARAFKERESFQQHQEKQQLDAAQAKLSGMRRR